MPFARHFLPLLVQVVWPIHQPKHTTSIPARCGPARATRWQHKAISHLLEKPTAATEQLPSKRSARCGDSAGKQTAPGMHTGDKSKAGHAQVLGTQLRSLCCHSLGLQKATAHQLVVSTAPTHARWVGRCLQVHLFSQRRTMGFLSPDFRCPPGVSQCGVKCPLQPAPRLCFRCLQ